jgi:hypothetical protein
VEIGLHEVQVGPVVQVPVRAGEPWAFRGVWRGRPVLVWLAEGRADPRSWSGVRGGGGGDDATREVRIQG